MQLLSDTPDRAGTAAKCPFQDALQDGFSEFTDDDICPKTGRVFRLAGLRFDARDLVRRITGIDRNHREERVLLLPLSGESEESLKQRLRKSCRQSMRLAAALRYQV